MSLCGTDYAIGAVRNMYRESRQDSAMVVMPSKLQKGLPRRTGSLCPECLKVIPATLYGFFEKVAEAGLNTIYLQFDGLREENYIKARGRPLLDIKLKVIERVRSMPPGKRPSIVLVPTMVN